ncbi:MAG: class I SAM-dependent methyltransferase [Nitrosomonadaceae bacterium]
MAEILMNTLVELFDKYKCDKGNLKHRYDRVYEPALHQLKDHPFRMLEIGVFKGNSTEAFVEYCPQVQVVGVDIFVRVDVRNIPILNHPQVHACKCDSLEGPNDEFKELAGDGFDIIIDDGLHTHEAQWKTFLNFFPYLKEGGSYFIEDVWPYDMMTPAQKQHPWLKKHEPAFSEEEYLHLMNVIAPYNYERHDLREGYDPDTFILEIKK